MKKQIILDAHPNAKVFNDKLLSIKQASSRRNYAFVGNLNDCAGNYTRPQCNEHLH
jgi:hypothetical protein